MIKLLFTFVFLIQSSAWAIIPVNNSQTVLKKVVDKYNSLSSQEKLEMIKGFTQGYDLP